MSLRRKAYKSSNWITQMISSQLFPHAGQMFTNQLTPQTVLPHLLLHSLNACHLTPSHLTLTPESTNSHAIPHILLLQSSNPPRIHDTYLTATHHLHY
jgi:hypothetical protein